MSQPDDVALAQAGAEPAEPGSEERKPPVQSQPQPKPGSELGKAGTTVASAVRGVTLPAHPFPMPTVAVMPKWRKRDEPLVDTGDIGAERGSEFMGDVRGAVRGDAAISLKNASPVAREAATGVKQRVRDLAGRLVLRPEAPQRSWWTMLSGASVIDALFKGKKTPKDDKGRDTELSERQDKEAEGDPDSGIQTSPGAGVIAGVGDRRPDLAMAALPGTPSLRPATARKKSSVDALRPKSRADCGKRCGRDGFCDPSNPLGCGGMYCSE